MKQYDADFHNGYRNEVGSLSMDAPSRSAGKRVMNWEFKAKGSDAAVPVVVSVEKHDGGLRFKANCDKLVGEYADSDINALHGSVKAALLEQAEALTGVHWEDWFEVVVKGNNSEFGISPYAALGASLHIQVKRLKRGVHPVNGTALTINTNGVVVAFPTAASITEPDAEAGYMRLRNRPEERSYIPVSPENRAALDEILSRMALLRQSMAGLLSQETVVEKLAAVGSLMPGLLTHST